MQVVGITILLLAIFDIASSIKTLWGGRQKIKKACDNGAIYAAPKFYSFLLELFGDILVVIFVIANL